MDFFIRFGSMATCRVLGRQTEIVGIVETHCSALPQCAVGGTCAKGTRTKDEVSVGKVSVAATER